MKIIATLETKIKSLIEPIEGTVAVYIKDLTTKEEISIGGDERFHAASMIKVPLLYEALRQVEEGKLKLDSRYPLKKEDQVGGCGILQLMGEGLQVTLEDLLHLMIDISDNTATNMLMDIVGKEEVNQTLKDLGIENTLLARKLMVVVPGVYSYTTAKDMGRLFEVIEEERLKGKAQKAIDILLAQQMNDRLSHHLNLCGECGHLVGFENTCGKCSATISDVDTTPVPFAHKTGEIVGVVHDGGIMYLVDHPVVVVVLTKGLKNNQIGHRLLRDIGVEVYSQFIKKRS